MKPLLPLLAIALAAPALAVAAAADRSAEKRLDTAIGNAMAEQGDIVTLADRRAIAAKCGLSSEAALPNSINFNGGGLHCPDGRIVKDDETRALSSRISARANAYVAAVMKKAEVSAAIAAVASEETAKALRDLRSTRN